MGHSATSFVLLAEQSRHFSRIACRLLSLTFIAPDSLWMIVSIMLCILAGSLAFLVRVFDGRFMPVSLDEALKILSAEQNPSTDLDVSNFPIPPQVVDFQCTDSKKLCRLLF